MPCRVSNRRRAFCAQAALLACALAAPAVLAEEVVASGSPGLRVHAPPALDVVMIGDANHHRFAAAAVAADVTIVGDANHRRVVRRAAPYEPVFAVIGSPNHRRFVVTAAAD